MKKAKQNAVSPKVANKEPNVQSKPFKIIPYKDMLAKNTKQPLKTINNSY
jgi:hypothetical protein